MMRLSPIPDSPTDLLRRKAETSPDQTAFLARSETGEWNSWNCAEVWDKVVRLASAFRSRGLTAGARLAIVLPSCLEWELAHQAGLAAGLTVVGIDPSVSRESLNWMLEHAGVSAVVAAGAELGKIDDRPELLTMAVGEHGRLAHEPLLWNDLLRNSPLTEITTGSPDPNSVATILFTSGTTGRPKGIEATHAQIMAACRATVDILPELDETDSTVCWLPMSALFQRMANLVALANGIPTHFVPDPRRIMEELLEIAPSFFIGVPRFFEKLQLVFEQSGEHPAIERWASRAKIMISGSAPLSDQLHEYFEQRGFPILEAYGLSENTIPMAMNRVTARCRGSVGKPLAGNEIRLADDGEILVRGVGVFHHYLGQPPPADRFSEDGFYRSGDIGRFSDDGFLFLTGRKADFIKTSTGRKISPIRIEAAYAESWFLDHVVVTGDNRPFLTAVATLNLAALARHLETDDLETTLSQSDGWRRLESLLRSEAQTRAETLARYERVQAWAVRMRPLSVERGELTASLKVRRKQVESHHEALLDQLYKPDAPDVLADWQVACAAVQHDSDSEK